MRRVRPDARRGMTLIEVLVAVGVMSMIAVTIWAATSQTAKTRDVVERSHDDHHQVRVAFDMLSRDLASAFLSMHRATIEPVRDTVFIGRERGSEDRLDFASFSHQRRYLHVDESDQCEISYFLTDDPEVSGQMNLVRRECPVIDLEPFEGGQILILVEDVVELDFQFFDFSMNDWRDEWDTTELTEQVAMLPSLPHQVRVRLARNDRFGEEVVYGTQLKIPMRTPIWKKESFPNPGQPAVVTQ